jgi:hypothetical protein
MPNKRSQRGKNPHFFCPYCQARLWRLGSTKHHLVYKNVLEIKENFDLSNKKARLLASQNSTQLDNNRWIEEFFCYQHGKMWLLVNRQDNGNCLTKLPGDQDWQRTNNTFDPNRPNPSVSEFTYRMSRQWYKKVY